MFTSLTIGQVLRAKGHGFFGIGSRATAYEALEIMAEKGVGALLVVDEGKLVGVFSERDYARKVILRGRSSKTTQVAELMSSPPIVVAPNASIHDCMVLMTKNHIRHLPVIDNDILMGVVSIGDAVNAIIASQESAIQDLENYVADSGYARDQGKSHAA